MTIEAIPTALHRGDDTLPYVDLGMGIEIKVLQVKIEEGLWVIRNRFAPGANVQTHRHTGSVYAFTTRGAWKYRESDFVNVPGSFLYEPAGSVHTLTVPETNTEPTEVWFAIWGANLNLDANGSVEMVNRRPARTELLPRRRRGRRAAEARRHHRLKPCSARTIGRTTQRS